MEIPKIESFWDEQLMNPTHPGHRHGAAAVPQPVVGSVAGGGSHSPYERNLNFATVAVEDGDYGFPKKKTVRDPLSHRIIEKRRRDRMNNCLADLARLLPPSSLRKGRGRIEKTEIVELAIKHLRHLQCHPCPSGDKCEFSGGADTSGGAHNSSPTASCSSSSTSSGYHSSHEEQFRLGFQECLSEAMHFLVEQEGLYAGDATCVRLVKHLNTHCETVLRDHWGNQGKVVPGFRRNAENSADFKKTGCSGASSSSGYHPNGSSSGSDANGGNDGEGTEPFALPVQNQPQHLSMEISRHSSSVLDYEAENSCSSTPLSIETSDVLSLDGKNNNHRMSSKPPIPSIICSHSSSNNGHIPVNSGSPANGSNGRSSDDGSGNSSTSSAHRYKFKSNIKQRFTADCQTVDDRSRYPQGGGDQGCPHGSMEGDREIEPSSDTEEIREENVSVLDDSLSARHSVLSGGEELEGKSIPESPVSRRRSSGGINHISPSGKSVQQISAVGTSSLHEKTGFLSATPGSPVKDAAKSSSFSSEMETSGSHEITEMKPSPEKLFSVNQSKTQLPIVITGEESMNESKGVPAFALHEKGLFYIPLTIDKSVVSSYINKLDTTNAPPLYPVTISVCFVVGPDSRGKLETPLDFDLSTSDCQRSTEFSHIPLPLMSAGSASQPKSTRKAYRESNNYLVNRFSQQRSTPSKDMNHHNRATGHVVSSNFHGTYHDGNSSSSSSNQTMNGLNRGNGDDNEILTTSSSGSRNGNSSSGSCGSVGNLSRSRKRSISSSPSAAGSGISMGYHSWNEKGSSTSNSHDFFNYQANTHNVPAITLHGHIGTALIGSGGTPSMSSMSHRHNQALNNFHSENIMREKELCYSQEKRGKKARSVDQTAESK